jgi:hypothetical protein
MKISRESILSRLKISGVSSGSSTLTFGAKKCSSFVEGILALIYVAMS